jgi:hypothetical protein
MSKTSNKVTKKCECCGKEISISVVRANKGRGRFCSRICLGKTLGGKHDYSGSKNPNWKGGVTKINEYTRVKKSREKYPEKYKARNAVSHAIESGLIEKGVCEICGETKTEAHHVDYSKPLEVKWLCVKHHKEIHDV